LKKKIFIRTRRLENKKFLFGLEDLKKKIFIRTRRLETKNFYSD